MLGRKTKREISEVEEIIEIEEDKTIIKLIYLNNNIQHCKNYSYIKFSFSDKISLADLIKKKKQTIELTIELNEICIIDRIELGNDEENIKEYFLMPIYINKTNTSYISLKHIKNGYFFEIIFYSRLKKNLPRFLKTSINEKIAILDNYYLQYRKKINIINVEKNFPLSYIKNINNLTLDTNSYKICNRIKDNGDISTSLHELKLENKIKLENSSIKPNLYDINKILNLFKNLGNIKELKVIHKELKGIYKDRTFKDFVKKYKYALVPFSEISNIKDDDVNILKEAILKFILKYFFIDIKKEKVKEEVIISNLKKMTKNIMIIFNDIDKFSKNKQNPETLKFRLYRATLFNIYSVTKGRLKNKVDVLSILAQYKQKIIDINKSSINNPYHKAVIFLK